jgi:hypothetical protein
MLVAEMILNSAVLKASYADYARDAEALAQAAAQSRPATGAATP